ncbi:hypothetical protein RRF57_009522 [Xylaria bambusicola]|uniref:Uncharacterized protein n=1 Tax=Xylaria bambusicola TaxID=326684 RepID=A0AAN7UQ77_9PEZI
MKASWRSPNTAKEASILNTEKRLVPLISARRVMSEVGSWVVGCGNGLSKASEESGTSTELRETLGARWPGS